MHLVGEGGKELAAEESRDGDQSHLKDKGLSCEEMDFILCNRLGINNKYNNLEAGGSVERGL